jgi:two-component system alkaline phosphatase synthesis response regulator PhoP
MPAERILIIEDDHSLRRASEIALRRAGYTVLSASGGREGLRLARAERPDLIVLDLYMPQPTGLDILRTLRAEEATRSIPVLVVSNSSMQRIVEEVESLGADYIVKASLSLRELADRVARRLAKAEPAPEPPAPAPSRPVAVAAPVEPVLRAAKARVIVEAAGVAEEPSEDDLAVDCAGCGFSIGIRFVFCPKCGRRLERVRAVSARPRRFR